MHSWLALPWLCAEHARAAGAQRPLVVSTWPAFFPLPPHPTLLWRTLRRRDAIAEISQRSDPWATYLRGRLVDRVAADGSLAAVAQPMGDSQAGVLPIFQQFPLECSVANKLYKGWDTKIVAYRVSGHWRHQHWLGGGAGGLSW